METWDAFYTTCRRGSETSSGHSSCSSSEVSSFLSALHSDSGMSCMDLGSIAEHVFDDLSIHGNQHKSLATAHKSLATSRPASTSVSGISSTTRGNSTSDTDTTETTYTAQNGDVISEISQTGSGGENGGKFVLNFNVSSAEDSSLYELFRQILDWLDPELEIFKECHTRISSDKSKDKGYYSVSTLDIPSLAIVLFLQEDGGPGSRTKEAKSFFSTRPWKVHHSEWVGGTMQMYPENSHDYYILTPDRPLCSVRQIHCGNEHLRLMRYVTSKHWKDTIDFYKLVLDRHPNVLKKDFCLFTVQQHAKYDLQFALKKLPRGTIPKKTRKVEMCFFISSIGSLVPLLPNPCHKMSEIMWCTRDLDGNKIYLKVVSPPKTLQKRCRSVSPSKLMSRANRSAFSPVVPAKPRPSDDNGVYYARATNNLTLMDKLSPRVYVTKKANTSAIPKRPPSNSSRNSDSSTGISSVSQNVITQDLVNDIFSHYHNHTDSGFVEDHKPEVNSHPRDTSRDPRRTPIIGTHLSRFTQYDRYISTPGGEVCFKDNHAQQEIPAQPEVLTPRGHVTQAPPPKGLSEESLAWVERYVESQNEQLTKLSPSPLLSPRVTPTNQQSPCITPINHNSASPSNMATGNRRQLSPCITPTNQNASRSNMGGAVTNRHLQPSPCITPTNRMGVSASSPCVTPTNVHISNYNSGSTQVNTNNDTDMHRTMNGGSSQQCNTQHQHSSSLVGGKQHLPQNQNSSSSNPSISTSQNSQLQPEATNNCTCGGSSGGSNANRLSAKVYTANTLNTQDIPLDTNPENRHSIASHNPAEINRQFTTMSNDLNPQFMTSNDPNRQPLIPLHIGDSSDSGKDTMGTSTSSTEVSPDLVDADLLTPRCPSVDASSHDLQEYMKLQWGSSTKSINTMDKDTRSNQANMHGSTKCNGTNRSNQGVSRDNHGRNRSNSANMHGSTEGKGTSRDVQTATETPIENNESFVNGDISSTGSAPQRYDGTNTEVSTIPPKSPMQRSGLSSPHGTTPVSHRKPPLPPPKRPTRATSDIKTESVYENRAPSHQSVANESVDNQRQIMDDQVVIQSGRTSQAVRSETTEFKTFKPVLPNAEESKINTAQQQNGRITPPVPLTISNKNTENIADNELQNARHSDSVKQFVKQFESRHKNVNIQNREGLQNESNSVEPKSDTPSMHLDNSKPNPQSIKHPSAADPLTNVQESQSSHIVNPGTTLGQFLSQNKKVSEFLRKRSPTNSPSQEDLEDATKPETDPNLPDLVQRNGIINKRGVSTSSKEGEAVPRKMPPPLKICKEGSPDDVTFMRPRGQFSSITSDSSVFDSPSVDSDSSSLQSCLSKSVNNKPKKKRVRISEMNNTHHLYEAGQEHGFDISDVSTNSDDDDDDCDVIDDVSNNYANEVDTTGDVEHIYSNELHSDDVIQGCYNLKSGRSTVYDMQQSQLRNQSANRNVEQTNKSDSSNKHGNNAHCVPSGNAVQNSNQSSTGNTNCNWQQIKQNPSVGFYI